MGTETDRCTRGIAAWQYRSGFQPIWETLVDDVFLELYINGQFQDRILTVDDDLPRLATGHFFLSLRIPPERIAGRVTLEGLRASLSLPQDILDAPCRGSLYERVCSCRSPGGGAAADVFLPANEMALGAGRIPEILDDFQDSSRLFKETGGVHGAGLYAASGERAAFFMDISRHNCFSKAVGFMIENGPPGASVPPLALMVSCRVNAEIVRMARRAGIRILLTRAAPSLGAYREAERSGLTLVGFLKADRFTVFSGRERIVP